MDEILIEEKKYVSSKRAAQITGYAKDYIGQLCREGRVPARLVGRSWYVLDSAIQDHRFGASQEPLPRDDAEVKGPHTTETWEMPRYEPSGSSDSVVPPVNRLQEEGVAEEKGLQESWKSWFDHFQDSATKAEPIETSATAPSSSGMGSRPTLSSMGGEDSVDKEVSVPLHILNQQYPPKELLPRTLDSMGAEGEGSTHEGMEQAETSADRNSRMGRVLKTAVTVVVALLAALSVFLAAISSGRADDYLISSAREGSFFGISIYNK